MDNNIVEKTDKFQQLGFYDSDLGDSVLLALSNVLQMQIIVFTTLHQERSNVAPFSKTSVS